jgi:hypothetical protein
MSVVERDLKSEYQKYVNAINRRKVCKKKTFRQFVDDKIGKKHRRKTRKVKAEEPASTASSVESTPSESEEPVSATESASPVEESASAPESASPVEEPVPAPVEEASASTAEATPASTAEATPSSTAEETKPAESKGIFDTIKSALTPSGEQKKTGGKRKKNKRKSGSRRK